MAPSNFISVSVASYDFGSNILNSFKTLKLIIANNSDTTVNITGYTGLSAPFSSNGVPISLVTGQSTIVVITFNPTTANTFSQTLAIANSGVNNPTNISLTGIGFSNVYSLPDINNLACGVVKCKLIADRSLPDLSSLIPIKQSFIDFGDEKTNFTQVCKAGPC